MAEPKREGYRKKINYLLINDKMFRVDNLKHDCVPVRLFKRFHRSEL